MEKPSAARTIMGGLFTAAKWLVFAAVVAGAIAAFAPGSAVGIALLGEGAKVAGLAAFKAGALGLFSSAGVSALIPAAIGTLSFLKGAVTTHKVQKAQIEQREMEAAARQQTPTQSVEKGAARGVTFEMAAGHPADDKSKTGVSFRTQIDSRREQTATRTPGA